MRLENVLERVRIQAEKNLERWGSNPRTNSLWLMIFVEEVGEVAKAMLPTREGQDGNLIDELIDCAAVAVEWIADITRRNT